MLDEGMCDAENGCAGKEVMKMIKWGYGENTKCDIGGIGADF